MKLKQRIINYIVTAGVMIFMPAVCFASRTNDSLLISRIWSYSQDYMQEVDGLEQNMYLRYTLNTERRNPTLFLVPTMYAIAKGERDFVGESYCKMNFRSISDYDLNRQVVSGTIPHNRLAMSVMTEYLTPNLYGISMYSEKILSPFHRRNRFYYKYRVKQYGDFAIVRFRPRVSNTQLVKGRAMVDAKTGRVIETTFDAEFDMIRFSVSAQMGRMQTQNPLPERCFTEASFKFLGNKINSTFSAVYNCPTSLPDSINELSDKAMMDSLRPIPLKHKEQILYQQHELMNQQADSLKADTTELEKSNKTKAILWDAIGENLISSQQANAGAFSMTLSPLLNPQYVSYSHSRGFSYKITMGLQYTWNSHRYLTLNPQFGYNFKQRQFYYTIPLRMNYNPKRRGYVEILWANGNRISSGALIDDIRDKVGKDITVPEFTDEHVQMFNNVVAFDWLEIKSGLVYHRRRATDRNFMRQYQMPEEYRSFAPNISIHLTPWRKGPTLTTNYERGFKNVLQSNLNYERWEFDASHLIKFGALQIINWRTGAGFYTTRNSDYFVDFANFRDNNLPTGWQDDWSGQFQLLDSRLYNESDYYLRGHISFESPLLALGWIPLVGKMVETERLYLSALSIEHTRPYFEIGYGFTNRWFSTGIFASFMNSKFEKIECKFTIELFRRW